VQLLHNKTDAAWQPTKQQYGSPSFETFPSYADIYSGIKENGAHRFDFSILQLVSSLSSFLMCPSIFYSTSTTALTIWPSLNHI